MYICACPCHNLCINAWLITAMPVPTKFTTVENERTRLDNCDTPCTFLRISSLYIHMHINLISVKLWWELICVVHHRILCVVRIFSIANVRRNESSSASEHQSVLLFDDIYFWSSQKLYHYFTTNRQRMCTKRYRLKS